MAFANSVTLIITIIRPVPQFATTGVLMQLGARTEATLAKRSDILLLPQAEEVEDTWPTPLQHHHLETGWTTFANPLDLAITGNTISIPTQTDDATPSPTVLMLPLQARSPCGDPCGDDFFDKIEPSKKPKPKPKPKSTVKVEEAKQKMADPEAYIDMVIGLLGVCIMRV